MENWAGSKAGFNVWREVRRFLAYINYFWSMRYFLIQNIFSLVRFCLFVCFRLSYAVFLCEPDAHFFVWENFKSITGALCVQPSQSMKISLSEYWKLLTFTYCIYLLFKISHLFLMILYFCQLHIRGTPHN